MVLSKNVLTCWFTWFIDAAKKISSWTWTYIGNITIYENNVHHIVDTWSPKSSGAWGARHLRTYGDQIIFSVGGPLPYIICNENIWIKPLDVHKSSTALTYTASCPGLGTHHMNFGSCRGPAVSTSQSLILSQPGLWYEDVASQNGESTGHGSTTSREEPR
jgi:hypothetical protein